MWTHTFVSLSAGGRKAAGSGGHFAVAEMSVLPFGTDCGLPTREVAFPTNVIEPCYWVTSRPFFFEPEHSLTVKTKQRNGECFAPKPHPSIIIIILPVWPQALRCCSERRLSSQLPIDLFWNGVGIALWSSWAASWVLALRGARVVMAPHVGGGGGGGWGGGRGSVSLCKGMHWSDWHHFLFHHLLSSYCLSVCGLIIFAITPG